METRFIWHPSPLDNACRSMLITSAWIYPVLLDKGRMENAIRNLLEIYPILSSRMDKGNVVYPHGDILFQYSESGRLLPDVKKMRRLPSDYKAPFSLKKMERGCFPLLSIAVTNFTDGCILSVKASHLIMDGRCFYAIMNTLMAFYSGKSRTPELIFDDSIMGRMEVRRDIDFSSFYRIPKNALLCLIKSRLRLRKNKRIFISNERLISIKKSVSASRTALLSALLYEKMGAEACSIVHTADHRGRIKALTSSYGGNAASPLSPIILSSGMSLAEVAEVIEKGLKERLKDEEEYFLSYISIVRNRLPYLPFPLDKAWKSRPECLIINSFLSFDIYDGMKADEILPIYVFPPELPDPIRFFPAPPSEDGVYIFLNI